MRVLSVLVSLSLCSGCAATTGVTGQRTTESHEQRCNAPAEQVALRTIPLALSEQRQLDPLTAEASARTPTSFSWRTIRTAQVIDILSLLSKLEILEERSVRTPTDSTRLHEVRQEILSRVILAMLEVSSTVAKTSCEIERTFQVVDRLRTAETARVKQQTLWAIVIGAAAAVATGGLSIAGTSGSTEGILSVVGGTVAGALGITALYQERGERFDHADNILREVWENSARPIYLPPSVWRFLRRPMREEAADRTYRDEVIAAWRQEGRLGAEASEAEAARIELLFGAGGDYTTEDLQRRTRMLDSLRATILLMNQDLEQLLREVMIQSAAAKTSKSSRQLMSRTLHTTTRVARIAEPNVRLLGSWAERRRSVGLLARMIKELMHHGAQKSAYEQRHFRRGDQDRDGGSGKESDHGQADQDQQRPETGGDDERRKQRRGEGPADRPDHIASHQTGNEPVEPGKKKERQADDDHPHGPDEGAGVGMRVFG